MFISVNSHVNLTFNLWVKKGLVNGSPVIIRDIIYNEEANILNELPNTVIVELKIFAGKPFFSDEQRKNWIPINPKEIYSQYYNCTRSQYLLRLTYAITIHCSQGVIFILIIYSFKIS